MAYRVDALHHGGDLEPAYSRFRNKKARQLIAPGTPLAIHSKTNRTKAVICKLPESECRRFVFAILSWQVRISHATCLTFLGRTGRPRPLLGLTSSTPLSSGRANSKRTNKDT